jgi:hypothetical protein
VRHLLSNLSVRKSPRGYRRRDEQILQHAVVGHLELRGIPGLFYTHFPAGGLRSKIEAAILKGLGTKSGVPDLLLIHSGKIFCLELKTESDGRLSPAQVETQHLLRLAGAVVSTVWGVDEALAQLEAWGLISNKSRGAHNHG